MAVVSAGWALELCGDELDLDDLRNTLKPPFDPWVEDYNDGERAMLLLRSQTWANLETTGEMMDDARRLLELINGANCVAHSDARPLVPGITLRFDPNGNRLPIVIAATGNITLRGVRARGRFSVGDGGQTQEPVASPIQQWLQRANTDDRTADLLAFIARADNWFDIYKAMECIKKLNSGGATEILHPEWRRVQQTANCHRHAPNPDAYPLPARPTDLSEARDVLLLVARQVLEGRLRT